MTGPVRQRQAAIWGLGGAASVLLHIIAFLGLTGLFEPRPPEDQPPPKAELRIASHEVEESGAVEQPLDPDRAERGALPDNPVAAAQPPRVSAIPQGLAPAKVAAVRGPVAALGEVAAGQARLAAEEPTGASAAQVAARAAPLAAAAPQSDPLMASEAMSAPPLSSRPPDLEQAAPVAAESDALSTSLLDPETTLAVAAQSEMAASIARPGEAVARVAAPADAAPSVIAIGQSATTVAAQGEIAAAIATPAQATATIAARSDPAPTVFASAESANAVVAAVEIASALAAPGETAQTIDAPGEMAVKVAAPIDAAPSVFATGQRANAVATEGEIASGVEAQLETAASITAQLEAPPAIAAEGQAALARPVSAVADPSQALSIAASAQTAASVTAQLEAPPAIAAEVQAASARPVSAVAAPSQALSIATSAQTSASIVPAGFRAEFRVGAVPATPRPIGASPARGDGLGAAALPAEPSADVPAVEFASRAPDVPLPAEKNALSVLWSSESQSTVDPISVEAAAAFANPVTADHRAVRDRIGGALGGVTCARVRAEFDAQTGQIALYGHVPEMAARKPLLASMQALVGESIPIEDRMRLLPAPQCNALTQFAALGLPQSEEQLSNPSVIGSEGFVRAFTYSNGERLVLEMQSADYPSHIYIDYFTQDGEVVHIQPNALVPDRVYPPKETFIIGDTDKFDLRIAPPFGQEIIIAYAASTPLFDTRDRPIVEPADAYLAKLGERIAQQLTVPGFQGEWVYFFINTTP